jgi:hypothetical protein
MKVNELANVFEHVYNFEVQKTQLHTRKKPQHQMTAALANFVRDHDDKHTLLIIYYAGHGWSDGGHMMLAGSVYLVKLCGMVAQC